MVFNQEYRIKERSSVYICKPSYPKSFPKSVNLKRVPTRNGKKTETKAITHTRYIYIDTAV